MIHFTEKIIDNQIGHIKAGETLPFWSDGKFNMHDMLNYLLKVSGSANVWLSTFSISEAAIRVFSNASKEGLIKNLFCLFDYTVRTNKTQLLFFASNFCTEIKLLPNHSKVILIENDFWTITVIASANMTPNPRKEAGVIFTDKSVFDFYKKHLTDTMDKAPSFKR